MITAADLILRSGLEGAEEMRRVVSLLEMVKTLCPTEKERFVGELLDLICDRNQDTLARFKASTMLAAMAETFSEQGEGIPEIVREVIHADYLAGKRFVEWDLYLLESLATTVSRYDA